MTSFAIDGNQISIGKISILQTPIACTHAYIVPTQYSVAAAVPSCHLGRDLPNARAKVPLSS